MVKLITFPLAAEYIHNQGKRRMFECLLARNIQLYFINLRQYIIIFTMITSLNKENDVFLQGLLYITVFFEIYGITYGISSIAHKTKQDLETPPK